MNGQRIGLQTFTFRRSLLARKGPCGTTMTIHRYIDNLGQSSNDIDIAPSSAYSTPQHLNFFPIGIADGWALLVVVQHADAQSTGDGVDK